MHVIQHKKFKYLLWALLPLLLSAELIAPVPRLVILAEGPSLTLEGELAYLESCQLVSGALAQSPDHQLVIPYFANLAARALLPHNPEAVRHYLLWYLQHLNEPDRWGLHGTVYDYAVEDGQLVSKEDYDSADSYAATFLSLAYQYAMASGDWLLIEHHLPRLRLIAEVIVELQDADGLVWAKPNHRVKYLMDNAENYRGLQDWGMILHQLGHIGEAQRMQGKADAVRVGMLRLWDQSANQYAWGTSWWGLRRVRDHRWYPDGVGQLYPLLNGMVAPHHAQAQKAYTRLDADFPGWAWGDIPDQFPWAMVAYAALLVGDQEKAQIFLEMVAQPFAKYHRPYPWYILESAYTIKLLRTLPPTGGVELPT